MALSLQTDARNAPAIVPMDRIWELGFDGTWTPPARQGQLTLSYGPAYLRQDRLRTPQAAPAAQDYRAFSAYVGLAGQTDAMSWAGQLSIIAENDRTAANTDRTSVVLDLGVSREISESLAVDAAVSLTHVSQKGGADWAQADVAVGLGWEIVPGRWDAALEARATFTAEPQVEDGGALVLSTTYALSDRLDIEFTAARETGSYSASGRPETTAGVFLRLALDAPRG